MIAVMAFPHIRELNNACGLTEPPPETAELIARRNALLANAPKPGAISQLRNRWDANEVEKICQMLRDGNRNWNSVGRIGTTMFGGVTRTDLRGIIVHSQFSDRDQQKTSLLEQLDLAACLVKRGNITGFKANRCRFVGSDLGQRMERGFKDCDFTRLTLHSGWIKGEFRHCSFVGAKLNRCLIGGTFENCNFSASELKSAEFHGSYIGCRWEASKLTLGTCLPKDC